MTETILALLAACISGSAMAVQGTLNSALSKILGLLQASWMVHLTGLLVLTVLIFVSKAGWPTAHALTPAPWYTLLGGPLNVVIVYLVIVSIPRVGVARATTAIIVGQVATAGIIDHFGLFGLRPVAFSLLKGLGLALLAAGAKLLLS
ncbi:MAG: DMT family transporter [Bacillota bacterium]|nr:DMT family transporter [Bacillota bacterium]